MSAGNVHQTTHRAAREASRSPLAGVPSSHEAHARPSTEGGKG